MHGHSWKVNDSLIMRLLPVCARLRPRNVFVFALANDNRFRCVTMCVCCACCHRGHVLDVFVCQADPIATCSPSQSLSVSPMVKIHRESEQEDQRKLLIVSWGVGIWTTGYFPTGDFGERMLDEWSCEQVVMCVCVCVCMCSPVRCIRGLSRSPSHPPPPTRTHYNHETMRSRCKRCSPNMTSREGTRAW